MTERNSLFDMLDELLKPEPGASFCNCGTCQEAYEAARKGAFQLLDNQCGAWLMQIGIAYIQIAGMYMIHPRWVETGLDPSTAEEARKFEMLMREEMAKIGYADRGKTREDLGKYFDQMAEQRNSAH